MSLVEELSARTLDRLVAGTGATEVHAADGGAFLDVVSESGSTGLLRVFRRDDGLKLVTTTLAVPARGVVTCMVFAFAPATSALPHFTLDCGERPDGYAFHLDVLPRVELATNVPYLDEVFEPLTAAHLEGASLPGLFDTGTTLRQRSMMSPWMLVQLADEAAFRAIDPVVEAYADHWLDLLRSGLSAEVVASVAGVDLPARDAAVRRNLFSPEIDPVWGRVGAMVGDAAAAVIRSELQGPSPAA